MPNDNLIIDEIRTRLERDGEIPHPGEVAVAERQGVVTLRGNLSSFHQRRAAILAAKSVPGVRAVEDELLIDPRDRWEDGIRRGAALQALISSGGVPADRVDVTVADGWLILKGEVRHQEESNAAFAAVCSLPGIGGITNRIRVITAGIDG